jgi:hypothetical protein
MLTFGEGLTIVALIAGPILAIQIEKIINNRKEIKARKMQVFRTLMMTRANRLSYVHVEALNMIDIEFSDNQKIKNAWKLLLDNFENFPRDDKAIDFQNRLNLSIAKSEDLFTDMLYEMSQYLGYSFDKVHIKRGAYCPIGHGRLENDQAIIRESLVKILSGQSPVPFILWDHTKPAEKVIANEVVKTQNVLPPALQ